MQEGTMEQLWRSSLISGGNATYVEGLFETYLRDPNAVPEQWRGYFEKLPRVNGSATQDVPHSTIREQFELLAKAKFRPQASDETRKVSTEYERKQVRVVQLISAYRQRGHQKARLDPLELAERKPIPDLELSFHQLSEADFDTVFQTGALYIGKEEATLGEIVTALQKTYCNTVGAEFMHIVSTEERTWIQRRMDGVRSAPDYGPELKLHLLAGLTASEGLAKFLAARYAGTKRFGLEGGESLIPMLYELVSRAASYGAKEIVFGMAHRGRLNVLINILGKKPSDLIDEFEGRTSYTGSGDVKYHQGFSSNIMTDHGEVHLTMAFNPSHLEIVSPVVEGSVRARQDRRNNGERNQVVPIIVHGDAAFAGQGVVMETLQMSQTRAYKTGGTIHIVLNNQVGFTTSNPEDARSTEYCTDVAKMVQAPIFHVNGDDPEAACFVTQMAMDFRNEFKKDVVIDLVCYRRLGHNEADDPSITQPLMYAKIRNHPTTRVLYANKLIAEGIIDKAGEEELLESYLRRFETGHSVVTRLVEDPDKKLYIDWAPYIGHDWREPADTRTDIRRLQELGHRFLEVPENFVANRQVAKILDDRRLMAAGAMPVNWGFAETLAYATLLTEGKGYQIRITGQDVGRGTFSHRHAVLHNQKDDSTYIPLQHLDKNQEVFEIYDSLLSEMAVLAFEYGYATTRPTTLLIWEAQFGDFANGAQVVIDQFIAAGETKWGRLCGLTLFLPHGYEGQGPEHSSARLERYLQLCAEHNIQVCIPTTPAQIYHMLRRQMIRPMRRPLVVMTPKSLLRHKQVVSSLEELAEGQFHSVLAETDDLDLKQVTRLVLCSGKVYFDLRDARRDRHLEHVALIRLEQLYPFPEQELARVLAPYDNLTEVIWCQEEPMNQGAWYNSSHHMRRVVKRHKAELFVRYAGREASAAAAAGYMALHMAQQDKLIKDALGIG